MNSEVEGVECETPLTDTSIDGLDGLFNDAQANNIVSIIRTINKNAAGRASA